MYIILFKTKRCFTVHNLRKQLGKTCQLNVQPDLALNNPVQFHQISVSDFGDEVQTRMSMYTKLPQTHYGQYCHQVPFYNMHEIDRSPIL